MTQRSELTVFHQVVEDLETAEENARAQGWDLRYLQLSPGQFRGVYKAVALPGMFVTYEDYGRTSLAVTGRRPDDIMPIVLWLSTGPSLRFRGTEVTKDGIVLPCRSRDIDYAIEGGGRAYSIQLDRKSYRRLLKSHPWLAEEGREKGPVLSLLSLSRLKLCLRLTLGSSSVAPSVRPLGSSAEVMAANILSLLTEGLASRHEHENENAAVNGLDGDRPIYLTRAREFMSARPKEPLSLATLCAETGASARTLSNAFVKRYGISPVKYHSLMRLEGARRDLKRSYPDETSVTDVATDWGFWHLGRFSQSFRLQFGEFPSAILLQSPRLPAMPLPRAMQRPLKLVSKLPCAPCSPCAPKAA